MLVVYGSMLCPDCVNCREAFDNAAIPYEYRDFSESLSHLKAFLKMRDHDAIFDSVKEAGSIGIPCILRENGEIILEWESLL